LIVVEIDRRNEPEEWQIGEEAMVKNTRVTRREFMIFV